MCSGKTIKIYQAPHEERAIKIIFLDTDVIPSAFKNVLRWGCLTLLMAVKKSRFEVSISFYEIENCLKKIR
jgi:hypothetical protein